MRNVILNTVSIVLFLVCSLLTAQQKNNSNLKISPIEIWESGLPDIVNYNPEDYKASPQNWSFIKGDDGFMYVANTNGVIQFDGNKWRTIALKNKSIVRSLSKREDGKIYVGGVNDLGYLEENAKGEMQFYSLVSHLEPENKAFGDVWNTVTLGDNVFFMCSKQLIRWNGKTFKIWHAKDRFGGAFKVNNTIYIQSRTLGLCKIVEDDIQEVPRGASLNKMGKINGMKPYPNGKILLIYAYNGLYIYDDEKTTSLNENSSYWYQNNTTYKVAALSNGDYAIATTTSGLYIVNGKTGGLIKQMGKAQGLVSDIIYSVYEDNDGFIWVGTDNGISKINWASPFRKLNKFSGLAERVRSVSYNDGDFLLDSKGLYQLVKTDLYKKNKELAFKKIQGIEHSVKAIFQFNTTVLAIDNKNIYQINKDFTSQIIEKQGLTLVSFLESKIDSSRIFIGTLEGKLLDYKFSYKKWGLNTLFQVDGGLHGIVEEPNGNLWLGTYYNGIYYAKKQSDQLDKQPKYTIKKYDTIGGLPSKTYNFPYVFSDKVYATTQDGMYLFDKNKERFVKDTLLMAQYDKGVDAFGVMNLDKSGTIWQTVKAGFENKIYTLSKNSASELAEFNQFSDYQIFSIEFLDDIVLFLGQKGVLAYNKNSKKSLNENLSVKLRNVWINNDSLVNADYNGKNDGEPSFEIPFKKNNLRFEYTLPYYNRPEKNQFQYILKGFDNDWSNWSLETRKDYTNLPAGDYEFKVRSKNIFNQISEEDTYLFTIISPWYNKWWFYLITGLGLIGLILLFIKWRAKELKLKNAILEQTIKERTIEIRHKNEILNQQTEKLVTLDASKTRLYSNITHEFRTPLTVILGMTETITSNYKNKVFNDVEKSLNMIRRNGKNLLHLVNELLDLAKIESGAMTLNLVQTDIIPFVKYLSESFHSLAESKNINLTVYSEIDALQMDVDTNKVASIISNLLSNAIKFTPRDGKIIVHLNALTLKDNYLFVIKIQDNGLGFLEEEKAHLFDRFYQVNNTVSGQKPGTGIGLSLTKEFVELMNGNITVESTPGKGSVFTVQIPITNNAEPSTETKISIKPNVEIPLTEPKKTFSVIEEDSSLPLVLIIEDNEDVAHYLKTCLAKTYQTLYAKDGAIGIEMAFEHLPDIIISDVMMPNKDGFEVCDTLKADERTDHIPIVLLTAKVTTEDRLMGLTHGADAYLAKPFNQDELFTRLDQLILVRKKLIQKLEKTGFTSFLKEREASPQTKFLQEAIKAVHKNLDNVKFGPTQLAKEMRLSESQVYRKLKSIADKSTAIFIRSVRLQKAKELLQTTKKTISEIAYEVGFNDPSWFSRAFKEEFGFPPSEIIK